MNGRLSETNQRMLAQITDYHHSRLLEYQEGSRGRGGDGEQSLARWFLDNAGNPRANLVVPFERLRVQRDLSASGASAFIATAPAPAVDILRPFSTVLRAGVTVLPNLEANTPVPRTSATATVSWMSSESASASPSTPTLAATNMTPKIGIGVIQASRHFMKQASDPESWLTRELNRTAAQVIDQAVLQGSGASGQPKGILNVSGISSVSGTSLPWSGADSVLHMKKLAADANVQDEAISFIGTTAVRELLEAREKVSGNGGFIWESDADADPRGSIAGCPAFASTLMPTDTLLSGPFSLCYLGLWGDGITVEMTPYASAALFQAGIIQARVVVSCDVALGCDPAAFTKATSIT